jgi:hypothetical protein
MCSQKADSGQLFDDSLIRWVDQVVGWKWSPERGYSIGNPEGWVEDFGLRRDAA